MVQKNLESDLFQYGMEIGEIWGNELTEIFRYRPIPDQPVILQFPEDIEKLVNAKNFSKTTRILMTVGSENMGVISNTMITGSAIVTCGMSGISMTITADPTAKGFYALSCLLSATSATSGSMAVLARKCEISELALLTEVFGAAFLYLGNKAHAVALKVEGRPVPARYRRPMANYGLFNQKNNVAFVMPCRYSRIIEAIPFERIGRTVGFSISIYFYGRIILSAYRYGQQLIVKYKNKKFLKATKLFTSLIRTSLCKRRRLYHFVVT